MPKFFHSIRFRIHALSIGFALVISVIFLVIFLESSRKANFEHLEDIAKRTMQYLNADIQNALAPAIDMANNIAAFASDYNHEQNNRLLDKIAKTDPSVLDAYYGTALSRYEGGFFASGTNWNPYEEEPDWSHVKRPWFISAMQNPGKITITDPYEDSETHKICVTIVKTASDSIGKINGVVGIDVLLDKLTEIVNARKITEDGKSFLIDANGLYIIHQDTSKVMKDNILQDLNLDKSILAKQSIEFIDNMYVAVIAVPNTPNWYLVSAGSLKSLDKMDLRAILIIIAISIALAIIVSIVIGNKISTEIKVVVNGIKQVSGGDLTERLEIKSNDEIGEMSGRFNDFLNLLQRFMKKIGDDASNFLKTSQHLTETSHSLALGSEQTVSACNSVASTSEQMAVNIKAMANSAEEASVSAGEVASEVEQLSSNINAMASTAEAASANAGDVAGAAEEMSANISTIATAIEKMSMSIDQISSNTSEVSKVAGEATVKSHNATDAMNKLGIAAKEIGQVTDVIKKIADKTNLLALNATIEAASAGAAGKGFAVVAGEIKELANQSSASADDIARRIDSIQVGTHKAVTVIDEVSDIITTINHSVESISANVSEQTKASNEIANNVTQANLGAKRVASAISEVAKGNKNIARNAGEANKSVERVSKSINKVAKGSKDIAGNADEAAKGAGVVSAGVNRITQDAKNGAKGAEQTNQQADVLAMIANDLKNVLNQFKV
ncbi:MAG: methyl-accepting chemotaxis protein [Fibromonadaceae bacterium]|jgi:methyl-accepting chemotaxis protein|nr:methyl-accepting chemotaxis protein [Fibromonadaceae bacterium]